MAHVGPSTTNHAVGPVGREPALARTVAAAGAIYPDHVRLHLGIPANEQGWVRCTDALADPEFGSRWQSDIAAHLATEHASVPPITAAAYALSWYAGVPCRVGGVFFHLARRVPRLGPDAVAFRRHPDEHWPDACALLDHRFWCLPDDPAATDADATVVDDERTLAAVLRTQVRAHADAFLSVYAPGARLPARSLLGAFVDALDGAVWAVAEQSGDEVAGMRDATLLLPGRTSEFRAASSLYRFTDLHGRAHVSRRRVACCFYYRLPGAADACFTCPRTGDDGRLLLASQWPAEESSTAAD